MTARSSCPPRACLKFESSRSHATGKDSMLVIGEDYPVFHGLLLFLSNLCWRFCCWLAAALMLNQDISDIAINCIGLVAFIMVRNARPLAFLMLMILSWLFFNFLKFMIVSFMLTLILISVMAWTRPFYSTDRVFMTVSFHNFGDYFPRNWPLG